MTNSIRRGVTTSLLIHGEVRNSSGTLKLACKAMPGYTAWLEAERWEGVARQAGRPAVEVNGGRSQSLRSTASGREPIELRAGCHGNAGNRKAPYREGRQESGCGTNRRSEQHGHDVGSARKGYPRCLHPGPTGLGGSHRLDERMLAALGNGVNGDKRFSHCWPHAFIAALGRFTMISVPLIASQSRC